MGYHYTPTYYYTSFQDTMTSLCKSILLPFSLKTPRLPDQNLANRHADTLKWQQESFHRILHLIGLHKEGIVPETDVAVFRSHLLDTLIASPADQEPNGVIRDKLLFLQELFYAKCITSEEYHSSKRPLLQRLAVQGAEINCRDVIVGEPPMEKSTKNQSPGIKSITGKSWIGKGKKGSTSIVLDESPVKAEKAKRRPFSALFTNTEERGPKSAKKQWGFHGLKKWKKGRSSEDESSILCPSPEERSDDAPSWVPCELVACSIDEANNVEGDLIDHVRDGREKDGGSGRWVLFGENDENFHPSLFSLVQGAEEASNGKVNDSNSLLKNPFHDEHNPFWSPRG